MKIQTPRTRLLGLLASANLATLLTTAQAATYSLADDFSYTDNRTNTPWSYRLDDVANNPLTNDLTGIVVAQGDQLFFRFDTCGDPSGDISRAAIHIEGRPLVATRAIAVQPAGAAIAAGSDFIFSVPATGARTFQWRKNGHAHSRRDECQLPNPQREADRRRHLLRRHRLRAQR